MTPESERDLTERIKSHLAAGTTDLAPDPYENQVDMYTSPAVLKREQERFFRSGVLCAGLCADVPHPNDWLVLDVAGKSVLLARDNAGTLRGFLNVCRHRGAPVAEGQGNGNRFTCPYHGWTYNNIGKLIAQPMEEAFERPTACKVALQELPIEEKHGLIYLSCDPQSKVCADQHLGDAASEIAAFDLSSYHRFGTRKVSKQMNWKLVVDTFLEAYHLQTLHKASLAPMIYNTHCVWEDWGHIGRLTTPRKSIGEMSDGSLLPYVTMLYFLFPNLVLIQQQDHIETFHAFPKNNSPDEADIVVSLYCPNVPETDSAVRHWTKNFDLLMNVTEGEDFALCEKIQKGFYSGAQSHIVYGRNEPGLQHYHRSIKSALGLSGGTGETMVA